MQGVLTILSYTEKASTSLQETNDLARLLPVVARTPACGSHGARLVRPLNSDTLDRWERSGRRARGASNDDCDMVLAFYTPGVGLLDADWLQRVSCRASIGWSLQRVTSLRHAVAAKVLLLGSAFLRLATYLYT